MSYGVIKPLRLTILAALAGGFASAQTIPFNLIATSNGSSATIANDASIGVTAQVGTQAQVVVKATYTGTSEATISAQPMTLGSTQFSAAITGTLPVVLTPGQTLTFTVTYAPTNANGATAQVTVTFTQPGTNGTPVSSSIVLTFVGSSPSFQLSYVLQTDLNNVKIPPGGTIAFTPPTQVNATAQANLDITNVGSGSGTITGITPPAAGPFKLAGIPLLPATLAAGQTLQLTVSYTPTAVEADTGQITITYQDGTTSVVNLTGNGATSSYSYSYLSGTTSTPVMPGGAITLPPVTLATGGTTPATSSVILTVTNKGNANGTINSINWTGPFVVTGVPTTPPSLKPGDTESFTITYTPTQVGTQTGQLVVGSDMFTLSAQGLGPQLTFSYVSNGITIILGTSGSVVFPAIPISQSETAMFTVTNSGTSAATIALISASPPFKVPALSPTTLASGQSSSFPITFTPVAVGSVNGTLLVNSTQVGLLGSGTAPPALSTYTFSGPTGTVSPLSQTAVTLTLAKPYPVTLNGTLTLDTSGNLGTDASVQFSTGGRTLNFVIPADSTSANFAGQGSQILLQTGTVAETVTLTPTFATTGGVDVTPAPASTLQFTIAPAAPVLLSIALSNETSSSFTLSVIGYSTTRDLNSLNVTFNPASGFNLGTTQFTIDLSRVSTLWFQSTSSQSFGGQFQIAVPFLLNGKVATGTTLLQSIASVSTTVSNSVGTSNPLQMNVQ